METLHIVTDVGVLILVIVAIFAVAKLFMVLGDVQKTLEGGRKTLEGARADVDRTVAEVNRVLVKVEDVVTSADKLLKEEVASTLHVVRANLANIEIATRALADTTTTVRRLTTKADAVVNTSRLISAGNVVAKIVAKQGAHAAGGLLTGFAAGVRGIFAHRAKTAALVKKNGAKPSARSKPAHNEILTEPEDALPTVAVTRKRK